MEEEDYIRVYEKNHGPRTFGFHIHHKIPRYRDGTNHPDNLVQLSLEDHAKSHLELYEEFKDPRDLTAYKLLLGQSVDPELYRLQAIERGRTVHRRHPEMFKKIAFEMGIANKDSWFYNDGNRSYLYKKEHLEVLSFPNFLEANPRFKAGRLPSEAAKKSREGWVILTDDVKSWWLPQEYRGRLEEYLTENPGVRVGRKKRAPFKRRTKEEMKDGLVRPSKRRI